MNNQLERYVFDVRTGRYRDLTTGKLVSTQFVQDVVEGRIEAGRERLANFAEAVMTGRTQATISDWQEAMAMELKAMHAQATIIGAGGRENVTQSDWGRLGNRLRREYGYLNRFAKQITNGDLSEAQIRNRMGMYGEAIWSSFWKANRAQHDRSGFTEERRVLDDGAIHCDDCPRFARRGWVPIDTLPPPGEQSECGNRCRCSMEFR